MPSRSIKSICCMLALAPFGIYACDGSDSTSPALDAHDHSTALNAAIVGATPAASALAKQVHSTTARYHSTVQATKAGYVVDSPCVAAPGLGGMGFHWVKHSLVDPVFNPLEPEAVLYEPNHDGKLKLIALEYIVVNVGQPAPTFAGQPFDVGGSPLPAPHWTLHLWVHKPNPSGLFAPFNPDVICPAP